MAGVLFDLDFTLIDATADMQAALERSLRPERAALPSPGLIRRWAPEGVGPLVTNAMRAANLPMIPEVHQRVLARFLRHYAAEPARHSTVFPGVVDALARLRASGRRLGICTNKPEALTNRILMALHLDEHFCHVTGGDSIGRRMPDPEPVLTAANAVGASGAVFVGVSESACLAAAQAGLPFWFFDNDGQAEPRGSRLAGRFAHFDALPDLISEKKRQLA